MFYFNPDKYDFWNIYDSIKHFYPLGIRKDLSNLYFSYPGLKELENIVVDNIHDHNHYTERWENFVKCIEQETGKEVRGTTYGQAPSFSAYVLLDTVSIDNLTRTKELHFCVSLVGPFYTVIGQDRCTIELDARKKYSSTSYLVVSPAIEFAEIFTHLCDSIENRFKGFRFVPYAICKQTIDGLSVRYSDENLTAVFHALFNDQVDLTIRQKVGNEYFKSEDWVMEGYLDTDNGWASCPPKT